MAYNPREIRELNKKIYQSLLKLNNTKSSMQVLNNLHSSCNFLNNLQHITHKERLVYYECFEYVSDFLRRNKQLVRTQVGFDPGIMTSLNNMLCKLQSLSYEH